MGNGESFFFLVNRLSNGFSLFHSLPCWRPTVFLGNDVVTTAVRRSPPFIFPERERRNGSLRLALPMPSRQMAATVFLSQKATYKPLHTVVFRHWRQRNGIIKKSLGKKGLPKRQITEKALPL